MGSNLRVMVAETEFAGGDPAQEYVPRTAEKEIDEFDMPARAAQTLA